jgi:DNA-binding CsgD family transcriptional regulator
VTAGASPAPRGGIVGREPELAVLRAFVAGEDDSRAVVLTGRPGIGKTTLWEAAVELARDAGRRVLTSRPSDAEARLAFAALIDLLDGVEGDELGSLPGPQLAALEVALLRASPSGAPPEAHAIVGFRNALRVLAEKRPLVVAIDDVQWLDAPSAAALTFAARRVEGEDRIRFLLAKRPGTASPVEQALGSGGVERLEVGPLNLDGVRRVLVDRLGLAPSRPLLRRIFDTTLGNPLFALEVGRMLSQLGEPAIGEVLPVPDAVEELLGTRVAGLRPDARRLLLAVALSPDLRVGQLVELGGAEALDAAVAAGVLVVDRERVRAWHPLLTATVVRDSDTTDQRDLHRALAAVVGEGELRTRHLALAAARPDETLAATVSAAAVDAAARGATQTAVELAEHALRLTPPRDPRRHERVLELAGYLLVAGEKQHVTELVGPVADSLPRGPARVRANLLLAGGIVQSNVDIQRCLDRALAESGSDRRLRAIVLLELASNAAAIRVEGIPEAEALAVEALPSARAEGHAAERAALYVLGWTRSLAGRSIDDLCDRFRDASDDAFYIAKSPERIAAQRLVWRGSLGEARGELNRLLAIADERGEPSSYALQRLHLCELELRAGNWDAAAGLLDEWSESPDRELLLWPMYERCRALLAAGRGIPDDARRWSVEAIARADETGVRWDRLEALRASGIAELLARDPEAAAERLGPVWAHTEREGVEDPGAFPVAPDLVEALVELGAHDDARVVTERLRSLAEQQEHPWGLVTARRCAALVRLAGEADDQGAAAELERAADELGRLGLRFDRARALLALGRALRRAKKWGAARDALERAGAAFDEMGSAGWAETARLEVARIGARRPRAAGELTPTERRVAELAAEGLSNKEIAQALVVTVNTVEFHLRNAYAKLGIRSRAQLAARLATDADGGDQGS